MEAIRHQASSFASKRASPSRSSLIIDGIELNDDEHIMGRYSVGKLQLLRHYQRNTSKTRVACVLLLSLFPAVAIIFGLELIPLGDPRGGLRANTTSLVRSAFSHLILTATFLLAGKQELLLSDEGYSIKTILCISALTSASLEVLWLGVAVLWNQYPVPMRELLGIVPWTVFVVIGHWIFARREIAANWSSIKMYLPVIGFELLLFYFFLVVSICFARVTYGIQIAMVLAFPIIKVVVKKWIWEYSMRLPDLTTSVTVCMVEISGALYQTMCIQNATSTELGALIMVMDFMQIALELRMYLGDENLEESTRTVAPSLQLLEKQVAENVPLEGDSVPSGPRTSDTDALTRTYSQVAPSELVDRQRADLGGRALPPVTVKTTRATLKLRGGASSAFHGIDGATLRATVDELVGVEKALHRVFACEVLVFVEFMKISMPILYSLYVRWVHALPHARPYNLVVSSLSSTQIAAAGSNAATYALLEGTAFALMCWFIQRHYGFSPLHQLAFVLESYGMTVQGKLLGSFLTIVCSITLHQGIDLTFQFNFGDATM